MAVLSFLTYLRGIYKLNLTQSSKVHYAIIQSLYDCFIMAKEDIDLMRLEMCLSTATGYWLDCWGDFFSVYRKSGEEDRCYSKRIIDSVISPKSTIPAIKDHVVDYLNSEYHTDYTREDILIREPWKEVAKYSHKGLLSKDARFYSMDYYCHAVIEISIPEGLTDELKDLVQAIKSAGIKVLWSTLHQYDVVSGFNNSDESYARYLRHVKSYAKINTLNGLILSNSSKNPTLSGKKQAWYELASHYMWSVKKLDKNTDDSIIITISDLMSLIEYYHMESIEEFKAAHLEYYNSVQPPILNGERVPWLVKSHKNWIWDTPTLSIDDFYELFTSDGKSEYTLESIIEAEDNNYNGYITFGDIYQPPIVISTVPN